MYRIPVNTNKYNLKHIHVYRSEGLPRTGYSIPVRDGVGVGDVGKFFCRRRRRRRPPKKRVFLVTISFTNGV